MLKLISPCGGSLVDLTIPSDSLLRNAVGSERFIEVFVNTPLEECERRDVKGMYLKARRGELKNFTGIDDPYEPPVHPELMLETLNNSAEDNARLIIEYLNERGFLK